MTIRGDTYCGIYCGACSVARHGESGRADAFVGCLRRVPAAELACGGCRSGSVYAGCRVCAFRDCATARGVERCVDCAEYPCRAFRKWGSAEHFLPHVGEAAVNLAAIRERGVDAWLAGQERRWSCATCGAPLSWYARECPGCGRDPGAATFRLGPLRRLVCRLVLPAVYRSGKGKGPD